MAQKYGKDMVRISKDMIWYVYGVYMIYVVVWLYVHSVMIIECVWCEYGTDIWCV